MDHALDRATPSQATSTDVALARQLRDLLQARSQRLVLAESCTAGRVAATLAMLPGISQWLCGSFVVYRTATKTAWLDVPASLLADPQFGPVSPDTTLWLAVAALERTPEADCAIAVTGDVGPGAPPSTDGVVFVACAARQPLQPGDSDSPVREQRICLSAPPPLDPEDIDARLLRLQEATRHVLRFAIEQLRTSGFPA